MRQLLHQCHQQGISEASLHHILSLTPKTLLSFVSKVGEYLFEKTHGLMLAIVSEVSNVTAQVRLAVISSKIIDANIDKWGDDSL